MVHILTVTLEKPVPEDVAEKLRQAISMLEGVQHVTYGQIDRISAESRWASQRTLDTLSIQLWQALARAGEEMTLTLDALAENKPSNGKSKALGKG